MMVVDTRQFDFENGRSVQPNNPCMLCGRISDTGLYSFCYRRIEGQVSTGKSLSALSDEGVMLETRDMSRIAGNPLPFYGRNFTLINLNY